MPGIILAAVILFLLLMALATGRENIWVGLGLGVAAGMFYLALGVFVRRVMVTFDRASGAVLIRTASVLGRKQQTLALTDVDKAIVETQFSRSTSSSGGRHGRTMHEFHRPALRTAQGIVPLNEIHVGGNGAAAAVAAINGWLGVKTEG